MTNRLPPITALLAALSLTVAPLACTAPGESAPLTADAVSGAVDTAQAEVSLAVDEVRALGMSDVRLRFEVEAKELQRQMEALVAQAAAANTDQARSATKKAATSVRADASDLRRRVKDAASE